MAKRRTKGAVDAIDSKARLDAAISLLVTEARELSRLIREWRQEHREDRADTRSRVKRIEKHLGLER
jgi:hypothetical protein